MMRQRRYIFQSIGDPTLNIEYSDLRGQRHAEEEMLFRIIRLSYETEIRPRIVLKNTQELS